MIDVVGGTYFEHCHVPYWDEFFGSGGRAAVALSSLAKVKLHTFASRAAEPNLDVLRNTFKIKIRHERIAKSAHFDYFHGLASPNITVATPSKRPQLSVTGAAILRIGMIEGDAVVHGTRVVYDPQSGTDPRQFSENGSTAKTLAIVGNEHEIELLSGGEKSVAVAARKLLKSADAAVVVVKQGPIGALVVTNGAMERINSYKTSNVWPIGSGDVFAGVFAGLWGEKRLSPFRAARIASRAVAYYCSTKSLPIPKDIAKRPALHPVRVRRPKVVRRAYLAAPFFTQSQLWMVEEARNSLLAMGMRVFSPFHDVGFGGAATVVPADLKALKKCDVVYAIVDGLDAGTLFEVGYARANGIPVVAFSQNEGTEGLKMLEGSGCTLLPDFATSIYHAVWTALER